jgi:hypothetical protein
MKNSFRELKHHLDSLISKTVHARWHKPSDIPPRAITNQTGMSICVPYLPLPLFFRNFVRRCYVQPTLIMPLSTLNSSSSPSSLVHIDDSSHQKSPLVKAYLQNMLVHLVVAAGRVAITLVANSCSAGRLDGIIKFLWHKGKRDPYMC